MCGTTMLVSTANQWSDQTMLTIMITSSKIGWACTVANTHFNQVMNQTVLAPVGSLVFGQRFLLSFD